MKKRTPGALSPNNLKRQAIASKIADLIEGTDTPIEGLSNNVEIMDVIINKNHPLRALVLRKIKQKTGIDVSFLSLQAKGKIKAFRGCPYSGEFLKNGAISIVQVDSNFLVEGQISLLSLIEKLTENTGLIVQFPQSDFPEIYELDFDRFSILKNKITGFRDTVGLMPGKESLHNVFVQGPVYGDDRSEIKSRRAAYYQLVIVPKKAVHAKGSELIQAEKSGLPIASTLMSRIEVLRKESPVASLLKNEAPFMPEPWDPV